MANIREIAKRAGVGIATVSRYMNNTGYVSDEVKLKIQKEIDRSGYIPNELARAIFTKNSKTIGLMIPNITNPFFNQIATVIEEYSNKLGYTLFLCNTEDNKEKELKYLEVLKGNRVAGIIASRAQCVEEYVNMQIPVVSFETHISPSIMTISSDNYNGGKMAFSHLYERGCKNILHIKGPKSFEATEMRQKGFIDAAREHNIDVEIFEFNDIAAAVVIKYLKGKNKKIPSEVQIIRFDNSFIGELLSPSLTTINQDIDKLGSLAVESLVGLINGEDVPIEDHFIHTKLIQRESTLT